MVVHETASSRIRRKNQSGDLIDHETWKVQQEEFFFPRFSPSGNRWPPTTTVSCRRQNPPAPAIHRFVRWVCGPERRRIVLWGDAPRTRRSAYKAQAIFFSFGDRIVVKSDTDGTVHLSTCVPAIRPHRRAALLFLGEEEEEDEQVRESLLPI
jgi:hypothetical protein